MSAVALAGPLDSNAVANRRRALPQTLAAFRGFHDGESAVVCGCGTSLASLVEPDRFLTIGVNDVGRLFQPDYLVVVNSRYQFQGDRFRYVEESGARALFTHLDLRTAHPNVVRFRLGRRGGTAMDDPNVLHYTRNSPYVAVCLALHMGMKRIGLLGVDFTDDHFFMRSGAHPLSREIAQIDGEYDRLREACAHRGVELFNLSESSRLTALPRLDIEAFDALTHPPRRLRIVSYATTPVAGVPAILGRLIGSQTPHEGRAVWARNGYGNGVVFDGDVEYSRSPRQASELLDAADVVVVHNGKVDPQHRTVIDARPVVTLAHNYLWNVDQRHVARGFPGLVVGQYQATLSEFAGWTPVANPIPLREPSYLPAAKPSCVTVCFTPSGKHERYPAGHRLYWHAKGYDSTLGILERLARRHDLALEVVRDAQVSHARSLAMKQRSHIVIDECVTGSYHRNSLEGLAAGCVVVNGVGLLPGVEEVLRTCAGDAAGHPFVHAGLDSLERVLESLISEGAMQLEQRGALNRRWMERHWDFATQWPRFWLPAIERAREHARSLKKPAARTASATVPACVGVEPALAAAPWTGRLDGAVPVRRMPDDAAGVTALAPGACEQPATLEELTVVIPHGGAERLRNLGVTVERLRHAAIRHVLVVESDDTPRARDLVERAGFRWMFVPREDGFHKARVMNVGASFVTTPFFVWLDADLLVTREFLQAALEELQARQLDCLVPWTSVHYLGEDDSHAVANATRQPQQCQPINSYFTRHGGRGGIVVMRAEHFARYDGVCEEFHGWGGEDNAFFHKAALLGRAAATRRTDQHAWHLFHPHSGGQGPEAAMASNPQYQRNLDLLREVRSFGSRDRFLRRFPPSGVLRAPWPGTLRIACAPELGRQLVTLFGGAVTHCGPNEAPDRVVDAAPPLAHAALLSIAAGWSVPAARPPLRLNLGCCDDVARGFVNVDLLAGPGVDLVADLTQPWPWTTGSVDEVRAWDVIEHLPDKIHTMNELWRVLRPGGRVEIRVPTTEGSGAFQDPTHVSFWNRSSFHYYEDGHPQRQRFAARYRIAACWRTVTERLRATADGPQLTIVLKAVKR